jgi:hypothetical protein
MNSPKDFGEYLFTRGVPKRTLENIFSIDELLKRLRRVSLQAINSPNNFGEYLFISILL